MAHTDAKHAAASEHVLRCRFNPGQLVKLSRTANFRGYAGSVDSILQCDGRFFVRVLVDIGLRVAGPGTLVIVTRQMLIAEHKLDPLNNSDPQSGLVTKRFGCD